MQIQRWLIRALDGLIVLLVIWLLAAAAYVSLGRQFVPAIADYRVELLASAQEITGRAISLESLRGEMQGSQPVLKMQGLRVHEQQDPASPTLLALNNVTARVDIWASLWERRLVMDALQIEGLELELVESADGRWRLHGLGERLAGNYDLDTALAMLFEQRRITLLDTRVLVSPHERPQWVFQEGEVTLLNGPGWHRLDGRVRLPEGQQVRWQVSALQDGNRWQDMSVGFFLDLPPIDWVEQLPPAWLERARLDQMVAGGRFWGGWQNQKLNYLRGQLAMPLLRLDQSQNVPELTALQSAFWFEQGERQRLRVQGLKFDLGDRHWERSRLSIWRNTITRHWQVQVDTLPLDVLTQLVPAGVLSERASSALEALQPTGTLSAVSLQGEGLPVDWRSMSLSAMLTDVGVGAWQGAPSFQGISGSLSGSPFKGELRVVSDDWAMHLPRLFPQSWSYQQLVGQMDWQWSESEGLRLMAPGMRAQGDDGIASVALQLQLPPSDQTPTMALRVSLTNAQATSSKHYIPTLSPAFNPKLAEWLNQAQIEGSVPLAVFEYQGSLRRNAEPGERSLSLYAQLDSGSLAFQPGWPRIEQVDAILRLDNQQVHIENASARFWETALTNVRVDTQREQPADGLQLHIGSDFAGPLADALRLMQDTALASAIGDQLGGWKGNGQVQGQFELGLALQESRAPLVDARWSLDAESLSIPLLQASLGDIDGEFTFSSAAGLEASGLQGTFLGRRVIGEISSQGGRQEARFSGQHSIEQLKSWPLLAQLPTDIVTGELSWKARAALQAGAAWLQLDSDLQGVEMDLPGALAKKANRSWQSRLTLARNDEKNNWRFNLGPDIRGVVQTGAGFLRGDLLYRNGEPILGPEPGLSIGARFEQFDLIEWRRWVESQRALSSVVGQGAVASGMRPSAAIQSISTLDLRAEEFLGLGQRLNDLAISGVRSDEGWLFDIDQTRVRGQIILPDLRSQPVAFNMQRLSLASSESEPRVDALASPLIPEDPLRDVDPRALPAMDVNIDMLSRGSDPVGPVRFQMRPTDQGASISGLVMDLRGLQLAGDLDWHADSSSSEFRGGLQAGDIGEVLKGWGYAPTVTSRQFSTTADLTWSGSPAFFALSRSTGSIVLDARNGTLQSGEGSADALRVFGLLNFNALTRRLRLDFSDLFGRGTAYDTLTADLALTDGVMRTRSPLVMDGPGAKIQLDGHIDLPERRIDMGMLVTLPVTNNLPLAAIIAGAPYIGGALFLADKILGDRVARFASVKYRVSGDWQQPTVEFEKAFDNEAALEE